MTGVQTCALPISDPSSERVILEIDEPDWNHNSGRLAFGPDGFLYWTVDDGGAFNDVGDVARGRGHPPEGNGQKLDTLLGKVLRLDVDHGTPYGILKDNPYVLANGINSVVQTRGKVFKLVPQ